MREPSLQLASLGRQTTPQPDDCGDTTQQNAATLQQVGHDGSMFHDFLCRDTNSFGVSVL
jgi:hypothetical protein